MIECGGDRDGWIVEFLWDALMYLQAKGGRVDTVGDEPEVYDARHVLGLHLSRRKLCN